MVKLNAYINLKGTAKEALEFYQSIFGGELRMSTFKEAGMQVNPEEENWLMHGQLTAGNKDIMISDTPSFMGTPVLGGFSMSLSGEEAEELKGYWDKLSEGAKINQPLEQAPWGDTFGMLIDKFGIDWMVNISAPKA
jgi:PhnB protein